MHTVRIPALMITVSLLVSACAAFPVPVSISEPQPRRFTLIVTNGTGGALSAQGCGCRNLGGMDRRAGFISRTRAHIPDALVLDCGNMLFTQDTVPGPEDMSSAAFMLSSIRHMQTTAVNISASDCAAGADFLKKAAGQLSLISANIRDRATGELLFSPHLITTVNRTRIGIFGLSGMPGPASAAAIHVENPLPAARRAANELQHAGCDVIILLSQLTEEQNLSLLAEVPGIHFVLGASDVQVRTEPVRAGDGYCITPGRQGTHVAVLEALVYGSGQAFSHIEQPGSKQPARAPVAEEQQPTPDPPARGSFTVELTALDRSVPADPDIELLIETCREDNARRALHARGLHYREVVPTVNISGLTETGRRRAVRLMNAIYCGQRRIADCAADTDLCRAMGSLVVEGVRAGSTDGAIQFKVLRETQARGADHHMGLDNPGPVH